MMSLGKLAGRIVQTFPRALHCVGTGVCLGKGGKGNVHVNASQAGQLWRLGFRE